MSAFILTAEGAGPPTSRLPAFSPDETQDVVFSHSLWSCLQWGHFRPHCLPTLAVAPSLGAPGKGVSSHTHSRKEIRRPKVTPFRSGTRTGRMEPATDLPLASAAPRLSWPPSGEQCRLSPTDLREGARTRRNESGSLERVFTTRLDSGLDSQAVTCAVSW